MFTRKEPTTQLPESKVYHFTLLFPPPLCICYFTTLLFAPQQETGLERLSVYRYCFLRPSFPQSLRITQHIVLEMDTEEYEEETTTTEYGSPYSGVVDLVLAPGSPAEMRVLPAENWDGWEGPRPTFYPIPAQALMQQPFSILREMFYIYQNEYMWLSDTHALVPLWVHRGVEILQTVMERRYPNGIPKSQSTTRRSKAITSQSTELDANAKLLIEQGLSRNQSAFQQQLEQMNQKHEQQLAAQRAESERREREAQQDRERLSRQMNDMSLSAARAEAEAKNKQQMDALIRSQENQLRELRESMTRQQEMMTQAMATMNNQQRQRQAPTPPPASNQPFNINVVVAAPQQAPAPAVMQAPPQPQLQYPPQQYWDQPSFRSRGGFNNFGPTTTTQRSYRRATRGPQGLAMIEETSSSSGDGSWGTSNLGARRLGNSSFGSGPGSSFGAAEPLGVRAGRLGDSSFGSSSTGPSRESPETGFVVEELDDEEPSNTPEKKKPLEIEAPPTPASVSRQTQEASPDRYAMQARTPHPATPSAGRAPSAAPPGAMVKRAASVVSAPAQPHRALPAPPAQPSRAPSTAPAGAMVKRPASVVSAPAQPNHAPSNHAPSVAPAGAMLKRAASVVSSPAQAQAQPHRAPSVPPAGAMVKRAASVVSAPAQPDAAAGAMVKRAASVLSAPAQPNRAPSVAPAGAMVKRAASVVSAPAPPSRAPSVAPAGAMVKRAATVVSSPAQPNRAPSAAPAGAMVKRAATVVSAPAQPNRAPSVAPAGAMVKRAATVVSPSGPPNRASSTAPAPSRAPSTNSSS